MCKYGQRITKCGLVEGDMKVRMKSTTVMMYRNTVFSIYLSDSQ